MSAWARMGAAGARKIVIIENADRMLDSARNALLKILEEPPARLTFILLTSRRGAMIPTILSRFRAYSFRPRDGEAGREVLERIFPEDSGRFATLDDFFRSYQEVDPQVLRDAVGAFLREALGAPAGPRGPARGSSRDFSRVRPGDDALFKDRAKFRLFLRELLEALRPGNPGGPALPELQDLSRLEDWAALARRTADSLEALNIGPEILAQRLFALFGRA
ncbi:MAG: DNA polymerase III subunit tau [Synergistetes bacterium ADurb.Bin520]|nr:MAG: DNA polymerase III subunit tau [Synergistetes bacterium ADurb.Bin520]